MGEGRTSESEKARDEAQEEDIKDVRGGGSGEGGRAIKAE